jgi:hypothetical protein
MLRHPTVAAGVRWDPLDREPILGVTSRARLLAGAHPTERNWPKDKSTPPLPCRDTVSTAERRGSADASKSSLPCMRRRRCNEAMADRRCWSRMFACP